MSQVKIKAILSILQLISSQSSMKILAIDDAQIRKEAKLRTQAIKKNLKFIQSDCLGNLS